MYPFVCKNCGETDYFIASYSGLYCHKCGKKYQPVSEAAQDTGSLIDAFIEVLKPYFEDITQSTVESIDIVEIPPKKCPKCGITWYEIAASGRLGCAEDYQVFKDEMSPWLHKIHGSNKHKHRKK